MKKLFYFVMQIGILTISFKANAYQFSWLGLNLFDNNVSVDKKNWSTETSGLIDKYDTLDGAPGSKQTVFVNRFDRSQIQSITVRTNNVFPGNPRENNWWARIVSSDGVITCDMAVDKVEAKNYCVSISANNCEKIKKIMSEMTQTDLNKCKSLVSEMFEENTEVSNMKKLKSTFESNIPNMKNLPYRKSGQLTFYNIETACSEYFSINPKVGGQSPPHYGIPTKNEVKSSVK